MSEIEFKVTSTLDEYINARCVRAIVFWEGQKISSLLEHDNLDDGAIHIIGTVNNEPVAAARIRIFDHEARFERIAVRDTWRGSGYGKALVQFMIEEAERREIFIQTMHAQAYLEDFYKKLGFRSVGNPYSEAGIEHISMERKNPSSY